MELEGEFKQPEIGVIPENWSICTVGDKFSFKNGLNKEKKYFGYGTPIINFMDVFNNSGILSKNIKGKVFLSFDEIRNYKVELGDVLFTRTSEIPEEIGMSAVLLEMK
jgi:type I restriction enzyme S subunit